MILDFGARKEIAPAFTAFAMQAYIGESVEKGE